jgi:hypothetical protein
VPTTCWGPPAARLWRPRTRRRRGGADHQAGPCVPLVRHPVASACLTAAWRSSWRSRSGLPANTRALRGQPSTTRPGPRPMVPGGRRGRPVGPIETLGQDRGGPRGATPLAPGAGPLRQPGEDPCRLDRATVADGPALQPVVLRERRAGGAAGASEGREGDHPRRVAGVTAVASGPGGPGGAPCRVETCGGGGGALTGRVADAVAAPTTPSRACRSWSWSVGCGRRRASVRRSRACGCGQHSAPPFSALATPARSPAVSPRAVATRGRFPAAPWRATLWHPGPGFKRPQARLESPRVKGGWGPLKNTLPAPRG